MVKISSNITRYPVNMMLLRDSHFTPAPAHVNIILTAVGSIKLHCNCCTKTKHSHIFNYVFNIIVIITTLFRHSLKYNSDQ